MSLGFNALNAGYQVREVLEDPELCFQAALWTAARYFPKDIILGNLNPTLLQTATPQRIYDVCRDIIEQGKHAPGGFILAPGCGIPATAPPVNVFAMSKAAYDVRWHR